MCTDNDPVDPRKILYGFDILKISRKNRLYIIALTDAYFYHYNSASFKRFKPPVANAAVKFETVGCKKCALWLKIQFALQRTTLYIRNIRRI